MIDSEFAAEMLKLSALACIGCVYFFHVRRSVRRNLFRDDLFAIRTRVFDQMLACGKPFCDPAYVQVRDTINGLIRFADHLSPITATILWLNSRGSSIKEEQVHSNDAETQAFVDGAINSVNHRLARYLFVSHATGIALVTLMILRAAILRRAKPSQVFLDNSPMRAITSDARLEGRQVRLGLRVPSQIGTDHAIA
ncbi:MAG: hypothetical protein HUU22_19150 [Phycisphaerae bacterium]|nr:hypothetical protein [Phycisphaerae bacterium]NUQ48136.1 hypothetical protein [Phycisphaerae bacterium]